MALVNTGFECSFVLTDTGGNKVSRVFELTSADITEALADAAAILPLYAALTNAVIEGYRVTSVWKEDAFAYPVGNVNVEELALIVVGLTDKPDETQNLKIPAPKDLLFVSATGKQRNTVDVDATELLAFLSIYNPGSRATFSDGDSWSGDVHSGKRIHRGSRNG